MSRTTKKYRPYLSLSELKELHSLSAAKSQISTLTRYLGRYILDIDSGYRVANMETNPRQTMEEKLGILESPADQDSSTDLTTFESRQQYRYENDLMNPEEEIEYEKTMGLGT